MALVVTPDGRQMLVPDGIGFDPSQSAIPEYPTTTGVPTLPPSPPPPPPTQRLADLPEYGTGGSTALPTIPAVPQPQKVGINPTLGADELPSTPDQGPASVTGGSLQPQDQTVGGQAPADVNLGALNVPSTPEEVAKANATYGKQQAAQAAYVASPQGQEDAARAKQSAADAAHVKAINDDLAVERSKSAENLGTLQVFNDQAKQLEADRKAFEAKQEQTRSQKQAYVESTLKDVDDFKVDPNKEWNQAGAMNHVGWYIAMALSGIGLGMQGKNDQNPVVKMLQDKMQQSIRMQMDQRDQLKDKNARAEHELDKYDAYSKSREAQFELQSAKSDKWLAQQFQLTAQKFADPAVQAQAQKAYADLMQSSADHAEKSADFATNKDMQVQGLQLQKRGQDLSAYEAKMGRDQAAKFHTDEMKYKSDELDRQYAALAAQGNKAAAAEVAKQKEELQNRGVQVPAGVTTLPDGTVRPRSALLKQQDGEPYIIPKGQEESTFKVIGGAKQAIDALDKIRSARANFDGEDQFENWFTSTADGRALQQETARAVLGLHKASGINRFSGEVVDLSNEMLTGGLKATSAKGVLRALDQAREDVVNDFNANLPNYTGPRVDFPDPTKAPPPPESQDKLDKRALENAAGSSMLASPTADKAQLATDTLFRLSREAVSDDPTVKAHALDLLQQEAKNGATSGIRQRALLMYNSAALLGRASSPYADRHDLAPPPAEAPVANPAPATYAPSYLDRFSQQREPTIKTK
jgi:hypothetical protein